MDRLLRKSAGVSLVEALVAMAVMGVGTLAVLGAQTTLRFNADLSKQRSEAVRIAQAQIERARTFGDIAGYISGITSTAAGAPVLVAPVSGIGNATYSITRLVVEDTTLHGPPMKQLRVTVAWVDRIGTTQQVQMASAIHGTPPALAGSLLLPANVSPTSTPGGRHRAIPLGAEVVTGTTTTSSFTPPGAPDGVRWIFNNLNAVISSICTSSLPASCTAANRRYVSGVIRFATAAEPTPPTNPPAGYYFDPGETPQGPDSTETNLVQGIGVQVVLTSPTTPAADCYVQSNLAATARLYHCAVPVDTNGGWSGRIEVTGNGTSTPSWMVSSITDNTACKYRVCRYTPVRGCQPVVPVPTTTDFTASTIWGLPGATATCTAPDPPTTPPTLSRLIRNGDFPLNHRIVKEALLNQNFLIRKAADGCPADGPATQINTNTWHHQPAT